MMNEMQSIMVGFIADSMLGLRESYASRQLWQMAQMFLCGWVMMLSVQLKYALMQLGKWKYRQRMIGDFVFCIMWADFLWLVLMAVSGGLVRNYIIIGLLGGIEVYQLLCRRLFIRVCYAAARAVLFVWRWFWRIVLAPWRGLRRFVLLPCAKRGKNISKNIYHKIYDKYAAQKQELDTVEQNIIRYEEIFRDDD